MTNATGQTSLRPVAFMATMLGLSLLALSQIAGAGQPAYALHRQAGCTACGPGHAGHVGGHGHCHHCSKPACQGPACQGPACQGPACQGPACQGPACQGLLNHHGHDGHCLHHDTIEKRYFLRSQGKSWHSSWYDPAEGRPIALVVPPTAEFMSQYSWGVPSSRVMPIYHQFRRPYPGPGAVGGGGGGFLPTPNQPSDTVQFGVNAVRGPWNGY